MGAAFRFFPRGWRRKVINQKLVVPGGIIPLHLDHRIFQADIFQYNIFFEKKPVCDSDPYFAGRKNGIFFLIPDQHSLQVHMVEQGEVDMFYFNAGMKVF